MQIAGWKWNSQHFTSAPTTTTHVDLCASCFPRSPSFTPLKKNVDFVSGCNWCVALLLLDGALAEIRDRYSDWHENELTDVVDWEESSGSEIEIVEPAVATLANAP